MSELLSIDLREEPNAAIVAATGEVDLSTCGVLAEALAGLNGARRVIVDLTACTFIDSSGLGVLVRYANESAERDRAFTVRVNEQTRRIFDLTNLVERLGIEDA